MLIGAQKCLLAVLGFVFACIKVDYVTESD